MSNHANTADAVTDESVLDELEFTLPCRTRFGCDRPAAWIEMLGCPCGRRNEWQFCVDHHERLVREQDSIRSYCTKCGKVATVREWIRRSQRI